MKKLRNILSTVGVLPIIVVGFFVFIALFGSMVSPYEPNVQDLMNAGQTFSWNHLLGNDHLGRDTLSRLIAGAQTTLVGVTIILIIAGIVGLVIGTISGYFGGWIDELLMRIVDFGLSVPSLVVALAIVGVFGPSYWNMIIALAIAWVPIYSRLKIGRAHV